MKSKRRQAGGSKHRERRQIQTEDRGGKEGEKEGDWHRGGRRKIKRGQRV